MPPVAMKQSLCFLSIFTFVSLTFSSPYSSTLCSLLAFSPSFFSGYALCLPWAPGLFWLEAISRSRIEVIIHSHPWQWMMIFIINFLKSLLKWRHWIHSEHPSLSLVLFVNHSEKRISACYIYFKVLFQPGIRQLGQHPYWTGHKGDKHVTSLSSKVIRMGVVTYPAAALICWGGFCNSTWNQQCWLLSFPFLIFVFFFLLPRPWSINIM